MIINNQVQQETKFDGESHVKVGTIDSRKMAKLQYMLTNGLYSDAESAIIVELTNNGMDSVISSGKDPLENPVMVKLFRDVRGQHQLSIEDKGLGMDREFFENRFMNMLDSTKEEDDSVIGNWGIGGKCWSGMNRSVTFTVRKDGKECKFLCYKGEEFIESDLLYEIDTTLENGVLFEMQLKDWSEFQTFCSKAKTKLAYYDTVVLMIDGKIWDNKIYRTDLFQWSSNAPYQAMHFTLKDVVYTLDFDKLGISRINIPIALRFGLKDGLVPNPSREVILMSRETIQLIKDRIKEVAKFFCEKYNETVKEFDTLLEALDFIDVSYHNVILEGKTFEVSPLEEHSEFKFKDAVVKGITLRRPSYYKDKRREFIAEYEAIAYDTYNNSWKKKLINYELTSHFQRFKKGGKKVVLFQGILAGNVKEFLRDKYGSSTIYAERAKVRPLKGGYHLEGYRSLLLLDKTKKSEWRDFIKEWQYVQKTFTDEFFVDESKIEESTEFIEWLEDKKAEQKANREKGIYKGKYLNKQVGDITIAYGRLSALDKKTVVFEKKAVPIDKLYKNPFLTLYWEDTPENKEKASKYFKLTEQFKLAIALVGKRELTKLPKLHNIMTEQEYQKTNQFRKFVTAIKAKEVITIYESLGTNHETLVGVILKKHFDDVERLRKYYKLYWNSYIPADLRGNMMNIAEQYNLFDEEEMVVVRRVRKDVERFDFLALLKVPNQWDEQEKKKYSRIVNQMLLFRKLYHKQFPDFEIVEAPPVEVLQSMYEVDVTGELECPSCNKEVEEELEEVDDLPPF